VLFGIREKHNNKQDQHDPHGCERHAGMLQLPIVDALEKHHDRQADHHPEHLAADVVVAAPQLRILFRFHGRGTVHH